MASTDQKHHHLEATGRCRILGPTPDRVDQNLHCSRSPSWFDAAWFSLTRSPPSTASSRASLPRLWGEENHSSRKRVAGKKLSTQSCILWQTGKFKASTKNDNHVLHRTVWPTDSNVSRKTNSHAWHSFAGILRFAENLFIIHLRNLSSQCFLAVRL